MNEHTIFKHASGHLEAVKEGWSWPAFFFNVAWCFFKGLRVLGAATLLVIVVFTLSLDPVTDMMAGLGLCLVFGYLGNRLLKHDLHKRGYEAVGTVEAENPPQAVTQFRGRSRASEA